MSGKPALVVDNPWQGLRRYTQARIALGRSGASLPTAAHLAFQLAHAQARDAVHLALDGDALAAGLAGLGLASVILHSAATDRTTYLQRPDLGRQLDVASRALLEQRPPTGPDLALVVADGLSALAVQRNLVPLLALLLPMLVGDGWTLAPVAIVRQGRVAIGDELGQLLGARAVLVLVGERPGLSSPDSMGLCLTWGPRVGLTDASRNCISNVRPDGLSYAAAAYKLHYLLTQARRRGLTGVALKDETTGQEALRQATAPRNFLLK